MLGNKVRLLREKLSISRKELASELDISYAALAKYETNEREPDLETTKKFADYFGISLDELLDRITKIKADATPSAAPAARLPVFDLLAEGGWPPAEKHLVGWETAPAEAVSADEFLFVVAPDDSMSGARIQRGDLVLIKKQSRVESGSIALLALGRQPAVLRRVVMAGEVVILQPDNPNYKIDVINAGESGPQALSIIGVPLQVSFKL